jgi:hypothetical protein
MKRGCGRSSNRHKLKIAAGIDSKIDTAHLLKAKRRKFKVCETIRGR